METPSGETEGQGGGLPDKVRPRLDRFAWIVLAVALALRVAVMLVVFNTADPHSGDGPYYLRTARMPWLLGAYRDPTLRHLAGEPVTTIGPVYPVYLMPFVHLIPETAPAAQMVGARLGQAVFDTLTVLCVYLIAARLFGVRVGRVALVAQALDLRYVFAAGVIATETLFIAFFVASMLVYLGAMLRPGPGPRWGRFRLAGALLGLAQLTRPVPILFPVVLAVHAWLHPRDRRGALRGFAWMLALAALFAVPWMVRTAYVSGEFVPITSTAFVHFWRGARDDGRELTTEQTMGDAAIEDTGHADSEEQYIHVEGSELVAAGVEHIARSPLQWAGRIVRETAEATLQPYGTIISTPPGSGVRQAARAFFAGEGSLWDVLAVPGLWRRALMYVWHAWGLIGGVAGFALVAVRRKGRNRAKPDATWWEVFPLAGWVVYVFGVTAPLLVEPRYLFPAMFAFTIMAAYASVRAWDALRARGRARPAPTARATAGPGS